MAPTLGKVVGDFSTFTVEGVDAQGELILQQVTGFVTFLLNKDRVTDYSTVPSRTRLATPITAVIENGHLSTPGRPQDGGMYLIPNDAPDTIPADTMYRVSYDLKTLDDRPIKLASHDIYVTAGGIVDLGLVVPPEGAPPATLAIAEAAALRAAESARQARESVDDAIALSGGEGSVSYTRLAEAIDTHVTEPTPHPAYDNIPSLKLIFQNGLI